MMSKLGSLALTAALGLMACDSRTLIGVTDAGAQQASEGGMSANRVDGGGTCTPPVFPDDQPFTPPAGIAGTWKGYLQIYTFRSGSDAVKLVFDQAADGSNQLHVFLGRDGAPPPATDPTDYYPPEVTNEMQLSYTGGVIEGFPYLAHKVRWQGQRLTFLIAESEAWQSWCALQTSYPIDNGGYNCIPGGSGGSTRPGPSGTECISNDARGNMTPVPCAQFFMCGALVRYCSCDACGCSASTAFTGQFDVTFSGDAASGALMTSAAGGTFMITRTVN